MIESADEFYRLRTSTIPEEYHRAAHEEAPETVWYDIINRFPDMRHWVAQNKTVPTTILDVLADDGDWHVRHMVAMKRKLPQHLQMRLARDANEGVRRALVTNASVTAAVLKLLAGDEVADIREQAKLRL